MLTQQLERAPERNLYQTDADENNEPQNELVSYSARLSKEDDEVVTVTYKKPATRQKTTGLIIDYVGCLNANEAERKQWLKLFKHLRSLGASICVMYHDLAEDAAWFLPVAKLMESGHIDAIEIVSPATFSASATSSDVSRATERLNMYPDSCLYVTSDVDSVSEGISIGCASYMHTSTIESIEFVRSVFNNE